MHMQGILTLESFTAQALGLAVGSFAPSTEAALAIGPAVMVVWIVFGGYYANAGAHVGMLRCACKLGMCSLINVALEHAVMQAVMHSCQLSAHIILSACSF